MRKGFVFLFLPFALSTVAHAATWYVRPDGGTRYSSNATTGLCDGMGDTKPVGTTPNQHCAFSDVRMLWEDGTYTYGTAFPGWGWVIAGGDTVIIRGSIGTGATYRIGWNSASTYCDATGCWGITGSPGASGSPAFPSGTAGQHTRILGENYASCTSQSARTQLHGGWGVGAVLNFVGSSYVDVACLDITDFSNCGKDTDVVACESNGTITSDFANNGIEFNNTSTHDTLTDIRVHGMASDGILGATGDGVVATDLTIVGNADAGWNSDDASGTTGVGSLLVQNFDISWNGCVEEYPIVDPLPYFSCTDQSAGGYGDGFGSASMNSLPPGWQVHFDQGTVSYNTQDGLDALHLGGTGSSIAYTRVLAFGNEGQQLKIGGATGTVENSIIIGNCEAMTTQAIPGTPAGFGSLLQSPCRAGNTAVRFGVIPGFPATFQNNTIYSAGSIALELDYDNVEGPTNTIKCDNNIFMGFPNVANGANATSIFGVDDAGNGADINMLTNPGASWTHNVTFGQRTNWTCPASGESNAICTAPGLVDETYHPYGYGNMLPASGTSAVVGAGVSISGLTADYNGFARPTPPGIGALEFGSTFTIPPPPPPGGNTPPPPPPVTPPPPPPVTPPPPPASVATPTISPNGGSFSSSTQVTLQDSTLGSFIYYTIDGSNPTLSSPLYMQPFTLNASATVTAFAYAVGASSSPFARAVFTIAGNGSSLLTPSLSELPPYISRSDSVTAGYAGSLTGISFLWTFTQQTYGVPSVSGSRAGVASPAASISFPTIVDVAPLGGLNLQLGTYQVSVVAADSQGHLSNPAFGVTTVVAGDFSQMRVYPNPWRKDKHDGLPVTFDQLPYGSTVKIFTVSGHLVKTITPNVSTAIWDLTNDSGDKVASGIYLYLVTQGNTGYGGNAQKTKGKLGVIR